MIYRPGTNMPAAQIISVRSHQVADLQRDLKRWKLITQLERQKMEVCLHCTAGAASFSFSYNVTRCLPVWAETR